VKSLMLLAREVLNDLGTWCHVSTTRDFKTVERRFEHEGLSFLTITLSNFASDFQKSLEQGYVGPSDFLGFKKSGSLPAFMQGFFDLVFERSSGRLIDSPDPTAVWAIRQFCLLFHKINLDCSDERVEKAVAGYVNCEKEVRAHDRSFHIWKKDFERISRMLWSGVLEKTNNRVYKLDFIPKHGPGAVVDKLFGNEKYMLTTWTDRLEKASIHMSENVFSSYSEYLANFESLDFLEPGAEMPVKVITVPKTLKTPRIIAVEPSYMQYVQQGILSILVDEFRRDDNAANFVCFDSQVPNQVLAMESSLDGSLATLDLSEASDRVSNQHVRSLLRHYPFAFEAVDACRSRKADVPGHGVIRLAKFASMGSALCFPFESLVFATIVFLGIEQKLNRPLTVKDIKSFYGRVRVYGDDIIVPVEYVDSVVGSLESFGMKVNRNKSFWNGKFRESCGKDFYDGHDVTVTRVRSLIPSRPTDSREIISTVSLRNQLFHAGLWGAARYLDSVLERLIPFPIGEDTSPGLVRSSYLSYCAERYDDTLHRPLVKAMVVHIRKQASPLSEYGALTKCLTHRGEPRAKDHLEFAGRPTAVDIKRRWVPPY
jgi:hypothetical protein